MTDAGDVPDLVPARMVNEFAYCPRLFYLEWVQSRFVDSPDTVDGRYRKDSVFLLDLGDPTDMSAFHFLGERVDLPSSGLVVL